MATVTERLVRTVSVCDCDQELHEGMWIEWRNLPSDSVIEVNYRPKTDLKYALKLFQVGSSAARDTTVSLLFRNCTEEHLALCFLFVQRSEKSWGYKSDYKFVSAKPKGTSHIALDTKDLQAIQLIKHVVETVEPFDWALSALS